MLSSLLATTVKGCRFANAQLHLRTQYSSRCTKQMHNAAQAASTSLGVSTKTRNLINFRDLNDACPVIVAGKVFRCAAPITATEDEVSYLVDTLQLSELIDLRAEEEQQEADAEAILFHDTTLLRYTRPSWTAEVKRQVVSGSWLQNQGIVRHHISLLDRRRYIQGMLMMLPFTTSIPAMFTGIYDGQKSKEMLITEINEGGLELLYKVLLRTSKSEFVVVLRVLTEALQAGRPLAFFCKAGKDRTGLVAMFILTCCGATSHQIIEDYHRSNAYHKVALAGLENRPELAKLDRAKFEQSPREAMSNTLLYLEQEYGGAAAYLDTVGFSYEEQRVLKALLMDEGQSARL